MAIGGGRGDGLGIGGEAFDGPGHPPQGLQHQEGETGVEQPARDDGDDDGHQQAVEQEGAQFDLQRLGRRDHVDEVAGAITGGCPRPDRPVGMAEQGPQRIQQLRPGAAASQVDEIGRAGQVRGLQQLAHDALVADRHRRHPADTQQLFRRLIVHGAVGQGLDAHGGEFGRLESIHQPALVEAGGVGPDDQGLHRHGEQHSQQQQPRRQAVGRLGLQPLAPVCGRPQPVKQVARNDPGRPHGVAAPGRRAWIVFRIRGRTTASTKTPAIGAQNWPNRAWMSGLGFSASSWFSRAPIQQ